jgi:hypothetical protein
MDAPKERQAKIVDKPFQLVLPPVATGGASLMMVGSTRSGKTTALKHILDKYFPKHLGCLFSQSVKADAYKDMNYPLLVKSTPYIPELIHDAYVINKETKNHYPWLFIIDDHPLVKTDKELLKLCTIYRNSGISSITCCQNLGMLNPTCRSNINFVMLFHLNNTEAIEKTIKVFLRGYLPASWNYDKKIEWYSQTTKDHHFLLINNLEGTICRCKIQI